MSTSDPATPRRVLVVGGGMASLSCAYWLARQPGRFEVTVHQQGWRLGGKLASGRNLARHGRIEEHGLHVWSGFYENAFWMIREVYRELDRPSTHPLPTWDAAFSPWSNVSWFSSIDQHWVRVTDNVPSNDLLPGEVGRLGSPAELLARMVSFGPKLLEGYEPSTMPSSPAVGAAAQEPLPMVTGLPSPPAADEHVSVGIRWLFDGFREIAHLLEAGAAAVSAELEAAAAALQRLTRHWLDELVETDSEWLEVVALIDLGLAYVRGFTRDGVFTDGFDVINHAELTAYLRGAGAHEITLGSGFVRGAYSYIFAFRDGDPARPDLEAGTALRMLLRLLLASSGAVFWRMNAGAGDTVVAPVYQALDRRGVTVEFFHVLRKVEVDPASMQVVAVEFGVQATPAAAGRYAPLVDLDGLEVWPTTPRYDLLAQGAELQRRGVDLESAWTDWPDVSTVRLERGRDFDTLVLGLPPSSLALVAPDLIASSPALSAAVDAIPTVATQGVQLWMNPTSAELRAPEPATIATAFAPPIDTWADMSHLLAAEHWTPGEPPGSLQYLCGVLPTAPAAPPEPDPGIPAGVHRRAGVDLGEWLEQYAATLWPGAGTSPPSPPGFDPGVLFPAGADPLAEQFWSTNIDPTARYCQSPVGSMSARPTPDGTGIDGLVVVGDWVRTGLGYGCIEAAVMGGLAGARAISGDDLAIYGETDFPPFRGPW
jgi:uncharacterized protein with NAD-binding domain and iron-sulfur cluster